MRLHRGILAGIVCALASTVGTACDLVVEPGEPVRVRQGIVFGSFAPEDSISAPPAARVVNGGELIVDGGSLLGGNALVSSFETFSFAADAIEVEPGGRVRVENGLVRGGELAFTRHLGSFVPGTSGILALQGNVEINGGTIAGGPAAEFLPRPLETAVGAASGGTGVRAIDSMLVIRGGVLRPGPATVDSDFAPPASLDATGSSFAITGGDFRAGPVRLRSSRGNISGGLFSEIDLSAPSCVEIRGGTFERLVIDVPETEVFLFGEGFSVPFGATPASSTPLRISGRLEDGTPIDFELTSEFGGQLLLTPSRGVGCL